MRVISHWAKGHIWHSRLLILLIYVLLNIVGINLGRLLVQVNIHIPQIYSILFLIIATCLWVGYPVRKKLNSGMKHSASYVQRKVFDFSLGAITFLLVVYAGNHWNHFFVESQYAYGSIIKPLPKDSTINKNPLLSNFISDLKGMDVSKLSQKEKLRLIKEQIKTIKQDKGTSKGAKILLIILSIIVALGLLFGLAGLSCSLSCSGSEALAIILAIGGTFLIIFFLIRIIHRISNPRPKPQDKNK